MPPSVSSHLGTVLVSALLLVATFSSAGPVESAQPTIDDALLYEIVTHARPVLLFAPLTKNRILVIIGSTEHSNYIVLADSHVFEQPLESLGHDCIYLKPSTPFLSRWPSFTRSYRARIFAVPDSTGDNIILRHGSIDVSALHLDTDTIEPLPKLHNLAIIEVMTSSWALSSAEPVRYFYIDGLNPSLLVGHHFNNATIDQATNIQDDDRGHYICDNGQTSSGQQRIRVSNTHCPMPIKWTIRAGFTNATSFVLVDETNDVLIFDRSVVTSGQSTVVVKIPAEKFWVKWVPPLEPENRTQMSSTEKPAGTESTEPTTAEWPVVLVVAIAVPNLLLVLCLVVLGIYCLCKSKQTSNKSAFVKPPKAVSGPRNQQQDHKSSARTARKGIKEKHGPSRTAVNLKTKVASSSTGAKKATASSSLHQPGMSTIASKAISKVGKTSKSSAAGKSTTAVSKTSKNANASKSKRSLAGSNAPSSKAPRMH